MNFSAVHFFNTAFNNTGFLDFHPNLQSETLPPLFSSKPTKMPLIKASGNPGFSSAILPILAQYSICLAALRFCVQKLMWKRRLISNAFAMLNVC